LRDGRTTVRYVLAVITPSRKLPVEEELAELPPLDGEVDETEDSAPDLEEAELPKDTDDPFDDLAEDPTQGDGSAELELADKDKEAGWLDDADEAEGLDIGDAELVTEESDLLHESEEPSSVEEDEDLGDEPSDDGDPDTGEEGPDDEDEELREEDLPRLDADEGGAPDDEDFIDEDFAGEDAPLGVAWHSDRWERVGPPLAVGPVRALTCVVRGILAGGAGLYRLDLEGGVERLSAVGLERGDVTGVWASGRGVAVTTDDGELLVSRDQGASFTRASGWRPLVRPDEAAAGIDVVIGGGELWVRTALGTLLWSGDFGVTFEPADLGGFVEALGVDDEGALLAIVRTLSGSELARGRRGSLVHTTLTGGLLANELAAGRFLIAARGRHVALAPDGGVVSVSLDGGASWTRAAGTASATALAWSKGEGHLLVGLYDERQERTFLASVSSRGEARMVAEVTGAPPDAEGGVLTLVADEDRGVVWLGGSFGVAVFQPPGKSVFVSRG
jgi:hypothetical protein